MRCYHKILHSSYKDLVINEEVSAKIQQAIGPYEDLLAIVKRGKLQWYGHVSHLSGQAWSSPSPRGQWRTGKMEETGCKIICGAPTILVVKELVMMMMIMMLMKIVIQLK